MGLEFPYDTFPSSQVSASVLNSTVKSCGSVISSSCSLSPSTVIALSRSNSTQGTSEDSACVFFPSLLSLVVPLAKKAQKPKITRRCVHSRQALFTVSAGRNTLAGRWAYFLPGARCSACVCVCVCVCTGLKGDPQEKGSGCVWWERRSQYTRGRSVQAQAIRNTQPGTYKLGPSLIGS